MGSTAFVADRQNGLRILDIHNPADPRLLGAFYQDIATEYVAPPYYGLPIPLFATQVHVANDVALLSYYYSSYEGRSYAGFLILDVRDTANPVLRAQYRNCGVGAFDGRYVYCVAGAQLQIIDVENPANPVVRSRYTTPPNRSGDGEAISTVHVVGNIAYLSAFDADDYGLIVVDVHDPARPTELGRYSEPTNRARVRVVGAMAYLMQKTSLRILDVSDPRSITLTAVYGRANIEYRGIEVEGNLVYLNYDSGVDVVDVSEPAAPKLLTTYEASHSYISSLHVVNGMLYLTEGGTGLHVLQASPELFPPRSPRAFLPLVQR